MSQGHILVPVERIKKLEAGGGSSAATAVDIAIPLLKENWNLENEEYKQIVVVNGLDEDASPIIVLSPVNDEATQEELDAYNCLTNDVVVGDGFITFTAKQLPEISFTVIAKGASATGDAVATVTELVNKVNKLEENIDALNRNLPVVYKGEIVNDFLTGVKDNTFVYNPYTKRVDFQVVASINKTISDWVSVVKIPEEILPKTQLLDAYCGTVLTYDSTVGICYISPSSSGYLAPTQIGEVKVGVGIKLFGSYYTN